MYAALTIFLRNGHECYEHVLLYPMLQMNAFNLRAFCHQKIYEKNSSDDKSALNRWDLKKGTCDLSFLLEKIAG